jgi:hypothetical protein|tara:strand:- start:2184 stop:2885 length:702 start_codon:yes stop_codon:yes gene_type:complete
MAEFLPVSITGSDDFSATVVEENFDKLKSVSNATIGDYQYVDGRNVNNDRKSLSYHSFHKSSLTEVWKSGDLGGSECFIVIEKGGASTIAYNEWSNTYDVASSGLNYYLRENAQSVSFMSYVNLQKAKALHAFAGPNNATYVDFTIKASLVIDGSVAAVAFSDFTLDDDKHRGKTPTINHMVVAGTSAATKGFHTVHLKLELTMDMNGTPASDNTFTHFKGSGGGTTIVATYR